MKALLRGLIAWAVLGFMPVQADYTVTWTPPTENTDGSPLTDLAGYKLWCLYATNNYGNPQIINDPQQVSYHEDWAGPGDWKCKMRAFNSAGVDSADSVEVFFTLLDPDGDGNGHTQQNLPPIEPPPIPVRGNQLDITRKGYYTILGPDGDTIMKEDQSGPRQCTSLIECVEWVTKDGRPGAFTITQPPYEVKYE